MKVLVYAVTKIVSSCYATFRRNELAKVIMLYILMLRLRYTIYLMIYGVIAKRVLLFLYLSLVAPSHKSLMPVSMFHVIGAGVSTDPTTSPCTRIHATRTGAQRGKYPDTSHTLKVT